MMLVAGETPVVGLNHFGNRAFWGLSVNRERCHLLPP
jgi:hypothetical protein